MELAGGCRLAAEGEAPVLDASGDSAVSAVLSISLVLTMGDGGAGAGE